MSNQLNNHNLCYWRRASAGRRICQMHRVDSPSGRIPGPPELRERKFGERFPIVAAGPTVEQKRAWLAEVHKRPQPRSGCYVCRWHAELLFNGHVRCGHADGSTQGLAERGCVLWQREPGADDE